MKTTLNIDDTVMSRLRAEAARRGMTMSALVEAGLRRVLDEDPDAATPSKPLAKLPTFSSGSTKIDLADRDELYSVMEGD